MNCPKCKSQAIENQAGGKPFWYCRTCKDEVPVAYGATNETYEEALRSFKDSYVYANNPFLKKDPK